MSGPGVTLTDSTAYMSFKRSYTTTATATDDPGVGIASYAWTVDSAPGGSTATIPGADQPTITFTPDVLGVYVLTCTVTDGNALTAAASVTLTVRAQMWTKVSGVAHASYRWTNVGGVAH